MAGISGFELGAVVNGRYRIVERLTWFSTTGNRVAGVEYEYWLALDEDRDAEVWIQVAASRDTVAGGSRLGASVAALRRLNHPAIPAVLDFGEIEVVGLEAAAGSVAAQLEDAVLTAYGYVVLEPVRGESFAAALARGTLTEIEILVVLIQLAEVIDLIHEIELVHGHLSAHSVLLIEEDVLLVDLAVSLAIEAEAGGGLTPAADVYALAWLACVAFVGIEVIEAEFGLFEEIGFSPEDLSAPAVLTLELVEHRRAWAQLNLVEVYGVGEQLAALIVLALGEAATRPGIGEFVLALRGRRAALLGGGSGVAFEAGAVGLAAAGAVLAAESGAGLIRDVEEIGLVEEAVAFGERRQAEEVAVGSAVEETEVVMEAQALIQEAERKRVAGAAVAGAVAGVVGAEIAEAAVGAEFVAESAETTILPKVPPAHTPPAPARPAAGKRRSGHGPSDRQTIKIPTPAQRRAAAEAAAEAAAAAAETAALAEVAEVAFGAGAVSETLVGEAVVSEAVVSEVAVGESVGTGAGAAGTGTAGAVVTGAAVGAVAGAAFAGRSASAGSVAGASKAGGLAAAGSLAASGSVGLEVGARGGGSGGSRGGSHGGGKKGNHSASRNRRTLIYIGGAVVVIILGGTAFALTGGSSSTSPVASVTGTPAAAASSQGANQGGASAAGQGATTAPATTVAASASPSAAATSATTTAASGGGAATATASASAPYTPSPLATAPGSPSQALTQIKEIVSKGGTAGTIPSGTLTKLNQAVGTLQHEIGSGSSTAPGVAQLQKIITGNTLPLSISSQLTQLIPYLSPISGS